MQAVLIAMATVVLAQTPMDQLFVAVRAGEVTRVKALLAQGADVNAKGPYDQTPIFFAADRGHIEVVRVLVGAGAAINLKDTFYSMTPLMRASMKKRYEVIRLLLEKGAEGAGELLAIAAGQDDAEMAKTVIASGKAEAADLSAALARAERGKKQAMVEILKAAGAKPPPPANFAVEAGILNSYAGTYTGGRGGAEFDLEMTVDGGKLQAKFGNTTMTFGAVNNSEFRDDERQMTMVFQSDAGVVSGFLLKPSNQIFRRKK